MEDFIINENFLWYIINYCDLVFFLSFVIGSSFVLPSPHLVIDTLIEQLKTPRVYSALWSTVWKTLVVLLLGTLIGIVIGFMGINDTVYEIVRPLFMVIQSIPVVSWLAFVVFFMGGSWI